jgi:hypothetical protein
VLNISFKKDAIEIVDIFSHLVNEVSELSIGFTAIIESFLNQGICFLIMLLFELKALLFDIPVTLHVVELATECLDLLGLLIAFRIIAFLKIFLFLKTGWNMHKSFFISESSSLLGAILTHRTNEFKILELKFPQSGETLSKTTTLFAGWTLILSLYTWTTDSNLTFKALSCNSLLPFDWDKQLIAFWALNVALNSFYRFLRDHLVCQLKFVIWLGFALVVDHRLVEVIIELILRIEISSVVFNGVQLFVFSFSLVNFFFLRGLSLY